MSRVTQAHIDARTDSILDAAIRLFGARGVDRTTMADIAAEAGISAGAIYRYFPGKEQLLEAVFERGMQSNRELFQEAAASNESALEALIGVGHRVLEETAADEGCNDARLNLELTLAQARGQVRLGEPFLELRRSTIESIEAMLAAAREAGELDPSIDLHHLAIALLGLVVGTQVLLIDLGPDEIPGRGVIDAIAHLLRRSA